MTDEAGGQYPWEGRKPNPRFPACAQVARKLLAEVHGCRPGGQIPPEDELLRRAADVAAGDDTSAAAKAATALSMVREIGGL